MNNPPFNNINTTAYNEIVVCLFDGDYDLGFAALANSLVRSGFAGLIYAGYRGKMPVWTTQLELIEESLFLLSKDVVIKFELVDTPMHLGYFKPYFIKKAFELFEQTDKVYFFDVDIVVKAPWKLFSNWLNKGVCLCLDSNFHFIHSTHPWRKQWKALCAPTITFSNNDYYFNSGFLGIERSSIDLLERWIFFTEKYMEIGGDIYRFDKDNFNALKGDQDLLNAALTISPDIELSIIGKEGMGFTYPATLMLHAIGDVKPWRNFFIKTLIRSGNKPCMADKAFFINCQYPIRLFSASAYRLKKFDLFMASFFGRILG
jgi:hypothetical protein